MVRLIVPIILELLLFSSERADGLRCSHASFTQRENVCFRGIDSERYCSLEESNSLCDYFITVFRLTNSNPLEEMISYTGTVPYPTQSAHWFHVGNFELNIAPGVTHVRLQRTFQKDYVNVSDESLLSNKKCIVDYAYDPSDRTVTVTFDRMVCQFQWIHGVISFVDETCLGDNNEYILDGRRFFQKYPGFRLPWHRFAHVFWSCFPNSLGDVVPVSGAVRIRKCFKVSRSPVSSIENYDKFMSLENMGGGRVRVYVHFFEKWDETKKGLSNQNYPGLPVAFRAMVGVEFNIPSDGTRSVMCHSTSHRTKPQYSPVINYTDLVDTSQLTPKIESFVDSKLDGTDEERRKLGKVRDNDNNEKINFIRCLFEVLIPGRELEVTYLNGYDLSKVSRSSAYKVSLDWSTTTPSTTTSSTSSTTTPSTTTRSTTTRSTTTGSYMKID